MNEDVAYACNTESRCKTVIGMMLSFICDRGRENNNNVINLLYHLIIWMNNYTTFSQYEMETIHYRSEVKCRLGVQCKLQISGKMGTADYRLFKYISYYFHCWVLTRNRLFRLIMKVKSDHRSKFSKLSNWKEEARKKSGLQRDSNPWPLRYRCDALPTELWSQTLGVRSNYWVHIFPCSEMMRSLYEIIHIVLRL